jgi:tetratricopeptide (TPR) repeat protein
MAAAKQIDAHREAIDAGQAEAVVRPLVRLVAALENEGSKEGVLQRCRALSALGDAYAAAGDIPKSDAHHRLAVEQGERAGLKRDKRFVVVMLNAAHALTLRRSNTERGVNTVRLMDALRIAKEAAAAAKAPGADASYEAYALATLAEIDMRRRDYASALDKYGKAFELLEAVEDPYNRHWNTTEMEVQRAEAYLGMQNLREAHRAIERARRAALAEGDSLPVAVKAHLEEVARRVGFEVVPSYKRFFGT